jgi:hypothetical protein
MERALRAHDPHSRSRRRVIGMLLHSVDGEHFVRCRCAFPCRTYENHYLATKATKLFAPSFDDGAARRYTGPGRVGRRSAVLESAEGLFPASAARFGGKAGEFLCVAVSVGAFVWLIMNLTVALLQQVRGQ